MRVPRREKKTPSQRNDKGTKLWLHEHIYKTIWGIR